MDSTNIPFVNHHNTIASFDGSMYSERDASVKKQIDVGMPMPPTDNNCPSYSYTDKDVSSMSHLSINYSREIVDAALAGLERWWDEILLVGDLENKDCFKKRLSLGIPYELCRVDTSEIYNTDHYENTDIYCDGQFYFPVYNNGIIDCWLEITKLYDKWFATGFGGAANAYVTNKMEQSVVYPMDDVSRYILEMDGSIVSLVGIGKSAASISDSLFYRVSDKKYIPMNKEVAIAALKYEAIKLRDVER